MTAVKHEFASPNWFTALHAILHQAIDSTENYQDLEWSVCEVFVGVPTHLPQGRDGSIAWHYQLKDGEINFDYGEKTDVHFRVILDYAVAREMACFHVGGDPQREAEMEQLALTAFANGKAEVHGTRDQRPPQLPNFHDALAAITR